MNADPQATRQEVVRHFSQPAGKTVAIPAAERYSAEELAGMPSDAVQCSDGCGNPLFYTHIQAGDTVVDLGSGAGLDLLLAARRTGPSGRVIGVEMTEAMVKLARANLERMALKHVEVRSGLIEELPVDSGSVDWVISNCVINLSPEKERVFSEIMRVLKPGGRMLISDTVVGDVPAWLRRVAAKFSGSVGVLLDETKYLEVLRAAGLVDVEVKERSVFGGPRLRKMLAAELLHAVPAAGSPDHVAPLHRVWVTPLLAVSTRLLSGQVSSIKVFAQKPPTA